ncbi:hypothetical protein [Streptomyces sp. NPDC048473]|uniref:hypothetical protein n=1 Tax=unclassified Streptomyces TaxID=2593676 RepID=UPI0037175198
MSLFVACLPVEQRTGTSGAASGMLQPMQKTGGPVGLAVLVTVFGSVSRDWAEKPKGVGQSLRAHAHVHAHIAEADGMSSAFTAGTVFAVLALGLPCRAGRANPGLDPHHTASAVTRRPTASSSSG